MAEENTPISFLDPLGPEFGRINPPVTDAKGYQPFEGSFLKNPSINFPEVKQFPTPRDTSIPNGNTQKVIKTPPTKPVPNDEWNRAFVEQSRANLMAQANPYNYGKMYAYNAGPDGNAFYKRYAAYGQEKFDKIGFTPFRDNESVFNSQTSQWNDFTRMMTHSFIPLATLGFTSGPRSLMRALKGDFGADLEDGEKYAELAAIGQSSKGGIGAFSSNLVMNFGYTAGIIVEAIAEEVVGTLLAAPTGGASFFAATANNMRKVPMLRQVLGTAKTGNVYNKTLNNLNKVENAKTYWNAATMEKRLTSGIGGFINPLENTTSTLFQLAKTDNNITNLAKFSRSFGAFYRDVRGLNMALAEARLEGGMTTNDVYKELYDDFYTKNGTAPDNETQKAMWTESKAAGMTTLKANTVLIYASNKVVLDNIVGKKAGFRNFIKSKTDDIVNSKTGNVLKNTEETVLKSGNKIKVNKYEFVERNIFNVSKAFIKQPLAKSIPFATAYVKGNLMEGFQEIGQEVIADATKNYYINAFTDPDKVATHNYTRGLIMDAIESQMSMQGLETFASGFFMGTLAGGLNKAYGGLMLGQNRIFNKDAYAEYKQKRAEGLKKLSNVLNNVSIKEFFDSRIWDYGVQSRVNAIKNNVADEKMVRDAEMEAFSEHLMTILEHNAMDSFTEQLESYRGLNEQDFEEMFDLEKGEGAAYKEKLERVIGEAKNMQKRYERIMEEFPDPFTPEQLEELDPNTTEGQTAAYIAQGWKIARKNAIRYGAAFDNVKARMGSITNAIMSLPELQGISSLDLRVLFDKNLLDNTKDILESEIESLSQSTVPGSKESLKNKKATFKALTNLSEALEELETINQSKEDLKRNYLANTKQKIEDVNPEELKEVLDEAYEELQKNRPKNLRKFEKAYKEYIRTLGNISQSTIFDSTIDDSFNKLYDYHKLGKEAEVLTQYINNLYDPAFFYEHAERNAAWMKELYENRKVFYEAQVEQALQNKENNDLLNALADQGIFISSEALEDWVERGKIPDEFIDEPNKAVIKKSHPDYFIYANMFFMALNVRGAKESEIPAELVQKIEELKAEMQEKIDALEKTERVTSKRKPDLKGKKTITVKALFSQMSVGEYADIQLPGDEGTMTVYKADEETLKLDNNKGDTLKLGTKDKYSEVVIYTKAMAPDPTEVSKIQEEYEQKIINLKKDALNETESEIKAEEKKVNENPAFNQLPQDLKDQLKDLFDINLINKGLDPDTLTDYDTTLETFIKTDPEASALIKDYVKEQKLKRGTATGVPQPFNVTTAEGKTVNIEELTKPELDKYIQDLKFSIKQQESLIEASPEEEKAALTSTLLNLQLALKKTLAYYPQFVRTKLTPEQKATVDKIQVFADAQDSDIIIPKNNDGKYKVKGVDLERMTTKLQSLVSKTYIYDVESMTKALATVEALFQTEEFETLNFINKEFVTAYINALENTPDLKGYSALTSKELTKLFDQVLEEKALTKDEFKEIIKDNLGNLTYEENRKAGTALDELIRDFFAGKQPEMNPEVLSQEAYDKLFDPDTGVLTDIYNKLIRRGFYFFPQGIIVYDIESGVAGELDILAVDREGNTHIIDIKTGTSGKWTNFNKTEPGTFSKKENYELQQTGYNNLLYNMIGQESTISLLPIQVKTEPGTGKTLDIEKLRVETAGGILSLSKDNVKEKIDSIIPMREPQVETTPVTTDTKTDIEAKKADIEKRKQALKDIMEATGDLTFIDGVADGTFVGEGLLNMNENGDVVLTRFTDSQENLTKGKGVTENLANIAGQFGGEQIATSGVEGGLTSFSNGVVGEYHIPLTELIQLIKDGYIVFAGLGNKEFVLSPHIADKYLAKINGKEINAKYDAEPKALEEVKPETPVTKVPVPDTLKEVDGIEKTWNKITDLIDRLDTGNQTEIGQELLTILNDLQIKELNDVAIELYKNKVAELNAQVEQQAQENLVPPVAESALQLGDEFVAKENVMKDSNNLFVSKNTTVKITKLDKENKKVTVKTLGKKPTQKTITFEELNELFMSKSDLENAETIVSPVEFTEQDKDILKTVDDTVKNFISDSKSIDSAIKLAEEKDLSSLEDDLLNDLDC
jgi:hypothetical protein